jgi:hypothetical protein
MSDRGLLATLCGATAIPFGLLGDFGPTGNHSILPWGGMFADWAAWVLVARWGISRGWWLVAHEDSSSMSAYLRGAQVQRAFRKQARRNRPDHGGDAAKFRELVEAKERVLDELASA